MQAEAELIARSELDAARSWAVRSGTKLLLFAISQGWPHLVGKLAAGLIDVLGCTLQGLSAQAMAVEGLGLLHLAVRSRNAEVVEVFLRLGSRCVRACKKRWTGA